MPDQFSIEVLDAMSKVSQDLGGPPHTYYAYVPHALVEDFKVEMGPGWHVLEEDENGVTFRCPLN